MNAHKLLFDVFENQLHGGTPHSESFDEFVDQVVENYLRHLFTEGWTVPPNVALSVVADIREDVREMLRKKTYGCVSLEEYRQRNGVQNDSQNRPEVIHVRKAKSKSPKNKAD